MSKPGELQEVGKDGLWRWIVFENFDGRVGRPSLPPGNISCSPTVAMDFFGHVVGCPDPMRLHSSEALSEVLKISHVE